MITRRRFSQGLVALPGVLLAAGAAGARTPRPTGPDFRKVIAEAAPAVVAVGEANRTLGSGFVVADAEATPHARVATAAHVVTAAAGALRVTLDGIGRDATVLALDRDVDVALLEVPGVVGVRALRLAAADARHEIGEWIVVLGNPFGSGITATIGIVSALPGAISGNETLKSRIQVNAAVNPGNSGGPVLDADGTVIGIANATIPGGFGLGFAIPADAVADLLDQAGRER